MNAHGRGKLNMLGQHLAGVGSRASVTRRPPALFYEEGLLKPYVVFDVASGREQRRGGGSVTNPVCHSAYCLPTYLSTEESLISSSSCSITSTAQLCAVSHFPLHYVTFGSFALLLL